MEHAYERVAEVVKQRKLADGGGVIAQGDGGKSSCQASGVDCGTVKAFSHINFVVFSQLVGVELPRGVASIFVVPCKIGYRTYSKYRSFVVVFLLIPCVTCCRESSRNVVLLI